MPKKWQDFETSLVISCKILGLGGASICVLAGHVHLGDEILSVNGASVVGVSHATAVGQLKRASTSVTLRLKSNKILEG